MPTVPVIDIGGWGATAAGDRLIAAQVDRGYAARATEALPLSLGVPTHPTCSRRSTWARNAGSVLPPTPTRCGWRCSPTTPGRLEVPADFRQAVSRYFEDAAAQAAVLLEIFAVALDLEHDFFARYTGCSTDTMRINYYQRSPGQDDPLEGQQRMGAHADYGMVTVLYADSVPGRIYPLKYTKIK